MISLEVRINNASAEILKMNVRGKGKTVYKTSEEAREKEKSILTANRVEGLIDVSNQQSYQIATLFFIPGKPEHQLKSKNIMDVVVPRSPQPRIAQKSQTGVWRDGTNQDIDDTISLKKVTMNWLVPTPNFYIFL